MILKLINFLAVSAAVLSTTSYASEGDVPTSSDSFMSLEIFSFYEGKPYEGAEYKTSNSSCISLASGKCILRVDADSSFEIPLKSSDYDDSKQTLKTESKFLLVSSVGHVSSKAEFKYLPGQTALVIADIKDEKTIFEFDYPKIPQKDDIGSKIVKVSGPLFNYKGSVTSEETGKAISGVQIFAIGLDSESTSNEEGNFQIELKKGAKISFVHPSFSSYTSKVIEKKSSAPVHYKLKPSSIQLKEFVVTAPHIKGSISALLDEKKSSKEVADVIGSEQMSKSGDSDAASALGRVTGLTLVDGKYIFIRGLDERYTAILLNDAKLPSPDPAKRVIPLDLIPTGIVESIKIQKSMVPSKTAEFGGGVISIRTKSYPDGFKASIGLSTGLKSAGIENAGFIPTLRGEEVYSYEGGSEDFTGLDDGTRELAGNVNEASNYKGKVTSSNYNEEEISSYTKSFDSTWETSKSTKAAPISLKADVGDKFVLGTDAELGYNLALLYGDKYDREQRELFRYVASNGKLDSIDKELTYDISKRTVKVGALAMVGAKFGKNHELKSSSILTRKTSDKVQLKSGSSGSGDDRFESTKLEWNERKLEFNQFSGKHTILDKLELNWFYSKSLAQRYLPDTREYVYEIAEDTGSKRLSTRSTGASRTYSVLKDNVEDYSLDIGYPVLSNKVVKADLVIGFNKFTKERESDTKRYFYTYSDVSAIDLSGAIESILSDSNISSGLVSIEEGTLNTDEYTARQLLDSHYASASVTLFDSLFMTLGNRTEWTNQQVLSYDKDAAEKLPIKAEVDNADSLPSANLTYKFSPKYQIRLGWSNSVARPEFRELSTATFYDDTVDMNVRGYPDLERSLIENSDIRFEYYPTPNESVSIGYFIKDVDKPIEKYYITEGADSQVITFRNSESATNVGIELDFLLKPNFFSKAYALTFGGNYSRVFSKTTIDPSKIEGASSVTSLNRPMQGVSPYSINGFVSFDIYRHATTMTLLLNEIGERITEIGTNNVPDIWEEPIRTIDVVTSAKFGRKRNWKAGFKAKDLAPTTRKSLQDGKVIKSMESRSEYSLSIGYKF